MNPTSREVPAISGLDEHADELLRVAQAFEAAAGEPHSSGSAPAALGRLEEALQTLSASWCEVAADAAPAIVERWNLRATEKPTSAPDRRLSHEQEAHLMATLHDVAAAFAHCARACRDGRSVVAPLIAKHTGAQPGIVDAPRLTAPEVRAA